MEMSPLNESGKKVDWWFMYKVPKLKADPTSGISASTGFEYAYYDSETDAVSRSPFTLDSDNGALFHTLDSLFSSPSASTGWLPYNDETPEGHTSFNLGHSKGLIGFDVDTQTAFWLLHSWPKFPAPDDSAQPSPMFGQTYLCIALSLDSARTLATQMHTYQEPQIYDQRLPTSLAVDDPLRLLTTGISSNDPAGTNVLDLTSRGGVSFKVIAKNAKWNDDFWNNLVVDAINANIDVETWIRGGDKVIPGTTDASGKFHVEDMKFISLNEADSDLPWAWPEVKDHAKWAISEAGQGDWVCVGDINRMISQRLRGGCTIAFQESKLWDMLSKTDKLVAPDGSTGLTQTIMAAAVKKASHGATAHTPTGDIVGTPRAPRRATHSKPATPTAPKKAAAPAHKPKSTRK